jgi:glucose-6-phosphate 1-dehydrogenase
VTAGKSTAGRPRWAAAALEHLRYVSGDYDDAATFTQVWQQLCAAKHRAYLVTPPALFGKVIDQLKASGCATTRRAVVEKPFRQDEALARPCKAQSEGVGAVTSSAGLI